MNNLLTPKLDLVFKMLFTKDDDLLTDLLNAVLNLSAEKRICTVKVLNPVILPETVRQNLSSLISERRMKATSSMILKCRCKNIHPIPNALCII